MILKIFMSRKNSKIYAVIILLMSLLFVSICLLKNYYINMNNNYFNNSYIFISYSDSIDKILNKINIKTIDEVYNDNNYFYIVDNNISDNNIIVSKYYYDILKSDDNYSNYNIKICDDCNNNFIYVNKNFIKDYYKFGYYITLSDWSDIEKLLKNASKEGNYIDVKYPENYNQDNIIIINLIKNMLSLIILLIFILYVVILIDLIIDGINRYELLYTLGMNYYRIFILIILEYLLYLLEFLTITFLTFMICKLIFKI